MSREKRLACPQCEETNNIVTRHRKRGPKVVRERFCRSAVGGSIRSLQRMRRSHIAGILSFPELGGA